MAEGASSSSSRGVTAVVPAGRLSVLHVAAEMHPFVKTGGLADVVGALPAAQAALGDDVRLLLPGYPVVLDALGASVDVASCGPAFGAARVRVLKGHLDAQALPVYAIDAPWLFRRPGGPYQDADGQDWPDNLQRFGLLGWVGAQLAAGALDPQWQPQLLHAHDWHAGMACAYLHAQGGTVPSVFTVHNLAYQGLFAHDDAPLLGLASRHLNSSGLEYHGQISLMKAGLKFADQLTTVSPSYAQEIGRPEFGHGLDGVIRARADRMTGVLNGIDTRVWNPAADTAIAQTYSAEDIAGKALCKDALQKEAGLVRDAQAPLLLALSRLTAQKGLDLLLAALPEWLALGGQFVLQGTGDRLLEAAFAEATRAHPGRMAVFIGYDEARAHRLLAGADLIAVPSRFEPCGLTQMYGLRYGTLPVVRRVGGLADTVFDDVDVGPDRSNGFCFTEESSDALAAALRRACDAWRRPDVRLTLQQRGMRERHSWDTAARQYREIYARAL